MAIGKPRGLEGKRPVYVYKASERRKVYVGSAVKLGDAQELFRDKTTEFKRAAKGVQVDKVPLTVREYATEWLEVHHGEGTRRPAPTTLQVNEMNLRRFLEDFGDRALDGGVARREALRWAKLNGARAKSVSAMFNDAIDDEATKANPFANRRHEESRGRKDIHPLTEDEVDRLAEIALTRWGSEGYGLVAKAWVLFGAWVGSRPGETFAVTEKDLDFREGLVRVHRVKGRKQTEWVAVARVVQDAINAMPRIPTRQGLLFPTVSGKPMDKGSLRYYWDPVRSAFHPSISRDRWVDLTEGQDNLDFYVLRHFCASLIVSRGGNEYDVAAQLGNTPQVARETYIHAYEDRQRERLRGLLDAPAPADLSVVRDRRGA